MFCFLNPQPEIMIQSPQQVRTLCHSHKVPTYINFVLHIKKWQAVRIIWGGPWRVCIHKSLVCFQSSSCWWTENCLRSSASEAVELFPPSQSSGGRQLWRWSRRPSWRLDFMHSLKISLDILTVAFLFWGWRISVDQSLLRWSCARRSHVRSSGGFWIHSLHWRFQYDPRQTFGYVSCEFANQRHEWGTVTTLLRVSTQVDRSRSAIFQNV